MGSGEVQNKLKLLRMMADLSQEHLAQALGVTRHSIMAIENGKYMPSIALALKIARFFKQPLEEIFWLDDEQV